MSQYFGQPSKLGQGSQCEVGSPNSETCLAFARIYLVLDRQIGRNVSSILGRTFSGFRFRISDFVQPLMGAQYF